MSNIIIDNLTIYILKNVFFKIYNLIYNYYQKFIIKNDLLIMSLILNKYDNINDLYISYFNFNIIIETLIKKNNGNINKYIYTYYNNKLISKLYLLNEKPYKYIYYKNDKIYYGEPDNKIILSLIYVDHYFFIHQLDLYNCGILKEYNEINYTYFNYKGEYRNYSNFSI